MDNQINFNQDFNRAVIRVAENVMLHVEGEFNPGNAQIILEDGAQIIYHQGVELGGQLPE